MANNPADPDELALAAIVAPPALRDQAPFDWPSWNGLGRSIDGGATWAFVTLPGSPGDPSSANPFPESTVLSDPIVYFLEDGTLLHAGLAISGSMSVYVQRYGQGALKPESTSIVARGAATSIGGLHEVVPTPYPVVYNDKMQLAEDPETGRVFIAWQFRYESGLAAHTAPMLAWSDDGGRTWSEPVQLTPDGQLDDVDGPQYWNAWPVVGRDGLVHVVFVQYAEQGQVLVVSSTDGGATFSAPTVIAHATFPDGGPERAMASVDIDRSGGSQDGRIYVTWAELRDGNEDVVVASTPDGVTWLPPAVVHEGRAGDQSFPQLAVDRAGNVGVLYLDTGADPEGNRFVATVATSRDGGGLWTTSAVASEPTDARYVTNDKGTLPREPTDPAARTILGDYNGIAGTRDGFLAAWQDGRAGTAATPYSEIWVCEVPMA